MKSVRMVIGEPQNSSEIRRNSPFFVVTQKSNRNKSRDHSERYNKHQRKHH
jgi:hypothetical protein